MKTQIQITQFNAAGQRITCDELDMEHSGDVQQALDAIVQEFAHLVPKYVTRVQLCGGAA